MSYAIYQTEKHHELLRHQIVEYVERNWEYEKEWVLAMHNIDNVDFYRNYMLKSTGYVTYMERSTKC